LIAGRGGGEAQYGIDQIFPCQKVPKFQQGRKKCLAKLRWES
jgi:hypothetical protein